MLSGSRNARPAPYDRSKISPCSIPKASSRAGSSPCRGVKAAARKVHHAKEKSRICTVVVVVVVVVRGMTRYGVVVVVVTVTGVAGAGVAVCVSMLATVPAGGVVVPDPVMGAAEATGTAPAPAIPRAPTVLTAMAKMMPRRFFFMALAPFRNYVALVVLTI